MSQFIAANGWAVYSIFTIVKQLESKDSIFAPYGIVVSLSGVMQACRKDTVKYRWSFHPFLSCPLGGRVCYTTALYLVALMFNRFYQ